jgi:hypothetical protein
VVFPLPMDVLEPFVGGFQRDKGKPPKPRPDAPAPPHGGEPVPGVEGSGLPPEPDPATEPIVSPEGEAPAAPGGGGGTRPTPGVTPADDAPDPGDLPPSRS